MHQETITNVKDTTTYLHLDVGYGPHAWARAAYNAFITPRRHGHVFKCVLLDNFQREKKYKHAVTKTKAQTARIVIKNKQLLRNYN